MTITEFAPAKINLALHVTGRRPDGYHLLDSLVVFCEIGDRVTVSAGSDNPLAVTGPFAKGVPDGPENLVLRAAALMDVPQLGFHLEKNLPAASGIGGGSSDAAAALRGIARLTGRVLPDGASLLELGADLPVCLAARPARMQGVGEVLTPVPPLPAGWLVLVNPGVEVPTGCVFRLLDRVDNPPLPVILPEWGDLPALAGWLGDQRNDLQQAAVSLEPVISDTLAVLSVQPGCLLARMSGSGATCFGLFIAEATAQAAASSLQSVRPRWWARAGRILS